MARSAVNRLRAGPVLLGAGRTEVTMTPAYQAAMGPPERATHKLPHPGDVSPENIDLALAAACRQCVEVTMAAPQRGHCAGGRRPTKRPHSGQTSASQQTGSPPRSSSSGPGARAGSSGVSTTRLRSVNERSAARRAAGRPSWTASSRCSAWRQYPRGGPSVHHLGW